MPNRMEAAASLFMDSVGELAEAGNNIRTHPQLTLERQAALRHGGISYVRHADPSGGYGCVIVE